MTSSDAQILYVLVPVLAAHGLFYYFMAKARLRRSRAALQRLRARSACNDEEFARQLGFVPDQEKRRLL